MKRCLLLFSMLCMGCYCFSQGNDSVGKLKDHYLRASRWQIPTGIIMAGVGTGMLVYALTKTTSAVFGILTLQPKDPGENVEAIGIVGDVLIIAGTPLLIIGEIKRDKAMRLKIDMQKAQTLLPANRVSTFFQPALTLTFDLARRKRRD